MSHADRGEVPVCGVRGWGCRSAQQRSRPPTGCPSTTAPRRYPSRARRRRSDRRTAPAGQEPPSTDLERLGADGLSGVAPNGADPVQQPVPGPHRRRVPPRQVVHLRHRSLRRRGAKWARLVNTTNGSRQILRPPGRFLGRPPRAAWRRAERRWREIPAVMLRPRGSSVTGARVRILPRRPTAFLCRVSVQLTASGPSARPARCQCSLAEAVGSGRRSWSVYREVAVRAARRGRAAVAARVDVSAGEDPWRPGHSGRSGPAGLLPAVVGFPALLADLQRLRTDRQVFDDVLGWRGRRTPITAVAADLSDPTDPGTRKAVARAKRAIRSASQPITRLGPERTVPFSRSDPLNSTEVGRCGPRSRSWSR
jgi:hypothetical protein